eukprot:10955209-Lingulodinium_polyedra.AAC.1
MLQHLCPAVQHPGSSDVVKLRMIPAITAFACCPGPALLGPFPRRSVGVDHAQAKGTAEFRDHLDPGP